MTEMNEELLREFKGKRVKLIVRGARNERLTFTVLIEDVSGGFLKVTDKFNDRRIFQVGDIFSLIEENGGGSRG